MLREDRRLVTDSMPTGPDRDWRLTEWRTAIAGTKHKGYPARHTASPAHDSGEWSEPGAPAVLVEVRTGDSIQISMREKIVNLSLSPPQSTGLNDVPPQSRISRFAVRKPFALPPILTSNSPSKGHSLGHACHVIRGLEESPGTNKPVRNPEGVSISSPNRNWMMRFQLWPNLGFSMHTDPPAIQISRIVTAEQKRLCIRKPESNTRDMFNQWPGHCMGLIAAMPRVPDRFA
jgi:hypothetical protein